MAGEGVFVVILCGVAPNEIGDPEEVSLFRENLN
jgi:hypothetical protein